MRLYAKRSLYDRAYFLKAFGDLLLQPSHPIKLFAGKRDRLKIIHHHFPPSRAPSHVTCVIVMTPIRGEGKM